MIDAAQLATMARGDEKHEQLTVDSRVLRAGYRTIAIANIAHIQLEQPGTASTRRAVLFVAAVILGLIAVGQMTARDPSGGIILLLVAGGLAFWAMSLKDRFALAITTNDGSRTLFTWTNKSLLIDAMGFITAKIDRADQTSRTTFNFNNSTVIGSQMSDTINN
jgi:hypothetical protein